MAIDYASGFHYLGAIQLQILTSWAGRKRVR